MLEKGRVDLPESAHAKVSHVFVLLTPIFSLADLIKLCLLTLRMQKGRRELARGVAIAFAVAGLIILLCSLVLTIRLARDPIVVLVSLDGVSYNMLLQYSNYTTHLNRIRAAGKTAKLLPTFPTKTWPNHYSILTGLYPEHHGIVANRFYDPVSGKIYWSEDDVTRTNPYFYLGTPFWQSVNAQQMKSACSQFPTCAVPHNGATSTPTYLREWDPTTPNYQRVQDVITWLDYTVDKQPSFIATYMSDVDDVSHLFGPSDSHVIQAIRELDSQIGTLYDGINSRSHRFDIDLIIVSDHGFSKLAGPIFVDDYLNVSQYLIPELDVGASPQIAIWTNTSHTTTLVQSLSSVPNAIVYRKEDLPSHWYFNDSARIAPVHLVASEGYLLTTRSYYLAHPNEFVGGNHGWDPDLPNMAGIFIGVGPSFPKSPSITTIQNVDLVNIMATILDVTVPENDGVLPYPTDLLASRYNTT